MINDIKRFIKKFKFDKEPMTREKLKFRMDLLKEEFGETMDAFVNGDVEEWVDGNIDLIVIAIGNLELTGVDTKKAWKTVMNSNMSKTRGVKPGREQSGGFDVIKEPGKFIPVNHKGNHGILKGLMK